MIDIYDKSRDVYMFLIKVLDLKFIVYLICKKDLLVID